MQRLGRDDRGRIAQQKRGEIISPLVGVEGQGAARVVGRGSIHVHALIFAAHLEIVPVMVDGDVVRELELLHAVEPIARIAVADRELRDQRHARFARRQFAVPVADGAEWADP